MKYLIFGINGMAGHMIGKYLMEQGHRVIGFARQENVFCKTIVGDVRKIDDVDRALRSDTFDYVINCIGVLNQYVDRDVLNGIYVNSLFPHLLTERLKDIHTKVIHISSDCVFEGLRGGYKEKDPPDASSYYGRTKALGEISDNKNLTIRTSIVGPEVREKGIGLFHWFMLQHKQVEGYNKVIWSGVTTLQLAKAITEDIHINQTGIYHLVNNEVISKYDLLKLFNLYCRENAICILKNEEIVSDKSLLNTKDQKVFDIPSYDQMVRELSVWINNHSDLYKRYRIA